MWICLVFKFPLPAYVPLRYPDGYRRSPCARWRGLFALPNRQVDGNGKGMALSLVRNDKPVVLEHGVDVLPTVALQLVVDDLDGVGDGGQDVPLGLRSLRHVQVVETPVDRYQMRSHLNILERLADVENHRLVPACRLKLTVLPVALCSECH